MGIMLHRNIERGTTDMKGKALTSFAAAIFGYGLIALIAAGL